ncbi:LD-carboxypeptidase [Roseivirga sp. E12]|uniref:S66 peptidase family protein n=1 Tax=Roseivirga sp. E12 TaxID=2819237 RepID=UPI001ABC7BED|nr:LD-carboxypeptidase [Roseivirga sp. E12]MBO3698951.1 LD-carboxypeptidase [Roseivirga sp. E12]
MNVPYFLKDGDKVAIVATAKRLESDISNGVKALEDWGLEVSVGEHVHNQFGYFAGTDEERIHDLQRALDDSSVKAIIFARGGYGTTRILDGLDFSNYLNQPKWLVGFSDLTSILLKSAVIEVPCIHGPVGVTIGKDGKSDLALRDLLFGHGNSVLPLVESTYTNSGRCQGKIVGGNLYMICESLGASNEIDTTGNILFLEEVGEAKYSVDRLMTKLKRSGKLDYLSGVIIGSFSSISDEKSYFEESVEEMLLSYFSHLDIPLVFGLEAGHEKRNYPLIIGMNCELEVSEKTLSITYIK